MQGLFPAPGAELVLLELAGDVLAVLICRIVLALAVTAGKGNNLHSCLLLARHTFSPSTC